VSSHPRTRRLGTICLALGLGVGLVVAVPHAASAAPFSVTTTADSGAGSLRQAILDANATPGADVIDFGLGGGTHAITLTTADSAAAVLPPITDAVVIDATSMGGWTPSTPRLEIVAGDEFYTSAAFTVNADDVTIKGLSIRSNSFDGFQSAITIASTASTAAIEQNQFGVNLAGTAESGWTFSAAIDVEGSGDHTLSDNFIANSTNGINLQPGSDDTKISGNTIGLARDGDALLMNRGVNLTGVANVDVTDNVVVGHAGANAGIAVVDSTNVDVVDNKIGVRADGSGTFSGRSQGGVFVVASTAPVTGLFVEGNLIKNGGGGGVGFSGGTQGVGGVVTRNVLQDNSYGIRVNGAVTGQLDLGGNFISGNSSHGIDTGSPNINPAPNGPPTITSAVGGTSSVEIAYNGPPGAQAAVLYLSRNTACETDSEGETPVGTGVLALDANGDFAGSVPIDVAPSIDDNLTALITPTTGISTEYSTCFTVTSGTHAPQAQPLNTSTPSETALPIVLTGVDLDDDPLTFATGTGPSTGTLSAIGAPDCSAVNVCTAEVTYTPDAGFEGSDEFTYLVDDGSSTSGPGTVSIDVTDGSADVAVTAFSASPTIVTQGNVLALTAKVRNFGPSFADDVLVEIGDASVADVPSGTTFISGSVSSSLEGSGACTHTPGSPIACELAPPMLSTGEILTIRIYLDTAGTPLGELDAAISVGSSTPDSNPSNNDDNTTALVAEPAEGEVRTHVPPSEDESVVATAEVVQKGSVPTPVAGPEDSTAAAVVVPGDGPGGRVVIEELDCAPPFCPAEAARPIAPAPTEPPVDNRVIRFVPPSSPYYDYRHPVKYVVSYDRSVVVGVQAAELSVLYSKPGDPELYEAVACARPFTAASEFPCVKGVRRLKSANVDLKRDIRVVLLATYDDPKIGTFR
jgi:parallel beta-helix repeat protein